MKYACKMSVTDQYRIEKGHQHQILRELLQFVNKEATQKHKQLKFYNFVGESLSYALSRDNSSHRKT